MATIKLTRIKALMPDSRNNILGGYYCHYSFKTFIDNRGNKTYFLNGKKSTKDEGNDFFRNVKKKAMSIERDDSVEEITYHELIDRLMKGYDNYVEYIDDYSQYRSACASNEEIRRKVNYLINLIDEEAS